VKTHGTWLLAALLPTLCQAVDFRAGNVEGLFDLTAAYGVGVRVEDVDEKLVPSPMVASVPQPIMMTVT